MHKLYMIEKCSTIEFWLIHSIIIMIIFKNSFSRFFQKCTCNQVVNHLLSIN